MQGDLMKLNGVVSRGTYAQGDNEMMIISHTLFHVIADFGQAVRNQAGQIIDR